MRQYINAGWRIAESTLIEQEPTGDWMDARLPCDVHMPLMACGRIKDPVTADYSFDSEWVAKRAWWFKREIAANEFDLTADVCELTIESIDSHADIYMNGVHIGRHISAHYPFVRDIKPYLCESYNELLIRVTTGLESVTDEMLAEINWAVCTEANNNCPERGDMRRAFVRRPQYSTGWDWGPKVPTCGIVKGAYIESMTKSAVRSVNMRAVTLNQIAMSVEIESFMLYSSCDADVSIEMYLGGIPAARAEKKDILLTSGLNYVDFAIDIADPQLWWPNGMGEQPLYEVFVKTDAHTYPAFKFGLRTIELDVSRIGENEREFRLIVNGVSMFCKGGDWIPGDSVYARMGDEKYRKLIKEAKNANFNMLRIWGGGIYERDAFYDACDENGILIWQDFMFGCSAYPDHLDWFKRECEKEIDYQTRRLRSRACLALFCGNNENHWIYNPLDNPTWKISITRDKQFGLFTANGIAARYVHDNCPHVPYWSSSPYGGIKPNDDGIGDQHHWNACMMNPDMNKRIEPTEYDKARGRFISEYGYPGPCRMESIAEYFDGQPVDRSSRVWDLHNNTFEKHTVNAGIDKHYRDSSDLTLNEYILYAGLTQATMLNYSLEAFRYRLSCSGGLFWMYNDTWGEVGWTIIDYYTRRKASFYGVKRAFEPVKAILRREGDICVIAFINDTQKSVKITARVGYLSFDGIDDRTHETTVVLPAHSRAHSLKVPIYNMDFTCGTIVFIPNSCMNSAYLRPGDYRTLTMPNGAVEVVKIESGVYTLKAHTFLGGVHFDEDVIADDNYFDMLPGEVRTLRVDGQVTFTGI